MRIFVTNKDALLAGLAQGRLDIKFLDKALFCLSIPEERFLETPDYVMGRGQPLSMTEISKIHAAIKSEYIIAKKQGRVMNDHPSWVSKLGYQIELFCGHRWLGQFAVHWQRLNSYRLRSFLKHNKTGFSHRVRCEKYPQPPHISVAIAIAEAGLKQDWQVY